MSKKLRAYGYVRVSGKGQIENDGPIRQRKAIEAFCAGHGIELLDFYDDLGVSGTLSERKGFVTMLQDAKGEVGVNCIIVESMTRLARDLMVSECLVRDLVRHRKALYSTEGGLVDLTVSDGNDPTRKFFRQVMGAMAEYDKSNLVLKLHAARARMKERSGRCEGQHGYGSRKGEKTLLELVDALRKPTFQCRRPVPWRVIVGVVNDGGFRKRTGKKFNQSELYRIYRNWQNRETVLNEHKQKVTNERLLTDGLQPEVQALYRRFDTSSEDDTCGAVSGETGATNEWVR